MAVRRAAVLFILNASLLTVRSDTANTADKCELNMNGDLPKLNQPLILNKEGNKYTLLIPEVERRNGIIKITKNDNIKLVCPGDKNTLRDFKTTSIDSRCQRNTEFVSNDGKNSTFAFKDALCAKPPKPTIKYTQTRCQQTAKLYEIGFEAEGWHPLISVCHMVETADTLYTKHTAIGAALRGAERESFRPRFETGSEKELYEGFNPNEYYVQKAQDKNFVEIFKDGKYKDYFGNDNYLSRGHLSPDGDFLFASWQFATYLYFNVAPQWQKVNSGNWLIVEKLTRKLAIKLETDLTVITGTNGILELPDAKGKNQKLYLFRNKIRIPEYFWKIIQNPKTTRGIAFVTSNNPFLAKNATLKICKNICLENNWLDRNATIEFQNPSNGLTICCAVGELRQIFPEIPFINVEGILAGPQGGDYQPKVKPNQSQNKNRVHGRSLRRDDLYRFHSMQ